MQDANDAQHLLSMFIKNPDNQRKTLQRLVQIVKEREMMTATDRKKVLQYLIYELFSEYLFSMKLEDVSSVLKSKHVGFDHDNLNRYQIALQEADDFLTNPPDIEEGVIECHRCGSRKTFSFSKQTRRADESATVFVRCVQCGSNFRL